MSPPPLLSFVVGARPNFVKAAPVIKAATAGGSFRIQTIHTGQHYDKALSELFFEDLEIPRADLMLEVGSGSHAVQTAEVMRRIEPILLEHRPACVIVFGDVNSTVAAALTATKIGLPVAHVESGLRSFDRSMPEEVNRIVTDAIADVLFVTEPSGLSNLSREGVPEEKIHFVGNTMIDALSSSLGRARDVQREVLARHGVRPGAYGVLTLHRPSNVDGKADLLSRLSAIARIAADLPIVFPVHPRTRRQLEARSEVRALLEASPGLKLCEPVGYIQFIALLDASRLTLTDSGGIQEETTALGVPCLTLRDNTERPVTIEQGTNRLAGTDPSAIEASARTVLAGRLDRSRRGPDLWDGHAAERILEVLETRFGAGSRNP